MTYAQEEREIADRVRAMDGMVADMWDTMTIPGMSAALSKYYGFYVSPRWICSAKQRLDGVGRPGLQMKGSGDADHIPLRDRD